MGEAQHIVQQQRGPLPRRQELQRGHEGQADLLTADDLILRVERYPQVGVADRLDPSQLRVGRPGPDAGLRGRSVAYRADPGPPGPQPIETDVGRDALEPGAERPRTVV